MTTTHHDAWRFSQGKRRKQMDADVAATLQSLIPCSAPSNDALPIATWDPYDAAASPVSMEEVKPQPPPEKVKPACDPSGKLCVMCLYTSMQVGKSNSPVQQALDESARKYWETGYLELEKLTHESYSLGFLPCLIVFDGVYPQF